MELRTQAMPSASGGLLRRRWQRCSASTPAHLTAPAVADFVEKVVERATRCQRPRGWCGARVGALGRDRGWCRLKAKASAALVQQLRHQSGVDLVRTVATAALGSATPAAAGKSLASAGDVTTALNAFDWSRLAPLTQAITTEADDAASARDVVEALRTALHQDELVTPIAKALKDADNGAFRWLANRGGALTLDDHDDPDRSDVTVIDHARFDGRARRLPARRTSRCSASFARSWPRTDKTVDVTWRVVP
jgi:hypothetical protein